MFDKMDYENLNLCELVMVFFVFFNIFICICVKIG